MIYDEHDMNASDQFQGLQKILHDPVEYEARIAGTNFHKFLNTFSDVVGDTEAQSADLLAKQIDVELCCNESQRDPNRNLLAKPSTKYSRGAKRSEEAVPAT